MPYSKSAAEEDYCPQCDTVKPIVQTVAWQPDQCRECGAEISKFEFDLD